MDDNSSYSNLIQAPQSAQPKSARKKLKKKSGESIGSLDRTVATEDSSSGGTASPGSFKRGGKVKRTGLAKVHRGERVLTRSQAKRYRKTRSK